MCRVRFSASLHHFWIQNKPNTYHSGIGSPFQVSRHYNLHMRQGQLRKQAIGCWSLLYFKQRRHHTGVAWWKESLFQHLERSGSSDNPNKTRVVYVILSVVVTWHEIDEPIPKTFFYFLFLKTKTKTKETAWHDTLDSNSCRIAFLDIMFLRGDHPTHD